MLSIIVDLDGVCFDPTERLERCTIEIDEYRTLDWERLFKNEEVEKDPVIDGSIQATQKISKRFNIIYLTGRSETCKHATFTALVKYKFGSENLAVLFMRKEGDRRKDFVMKDERIKDFKEIGKNIVAAIDDDYSGNLRSMYLENEIQHFYNFKEFFESDLWEGD